MTTASTNEAAIESLAAIEENRATTYGLLARLFRVEADADLLAQMKQMRFPARTENDGIDKGYRFISRYLSGVNENSVRELAIDYVRVFIGHGVDGFSAAYPYESIHVSQKRLLMQSARDEVRALFLAAGLEKDAVWNEGEDHIALELEYMQTLAMRCASALNASDTEQACRLLAMQRSFIEDHLSPWVPTLCEDMRRFAQTDMYKGLSHLLEGFIEEDNRYLGAVLVD